ncbi:aquaporin-1-like [Astyanax mexicanus]|uniref:Aquaporin-1-like n=1 Tax=Astyanax mexicanus TaxID=7994 RepID=A0A8T2LSQ0_ASTMX|nr:aquaporin-1-like [Astyanax mexicanus]
MAQEFRSGWFWRGVMAEFVGMILFIFIGLASAVGNKHNSGPDQEVKVALGFGLAVATLAQSLGHVSGAHLNPAVTVGALVSCRISALKALLYVSAQILGAVLASLIMSRLTPGETSLGVNSLAPNLTPVQGFGIEFLATFQLVLCVVATTDNRRNDVTGSAPLAIGLSVGLGHLAAISYTGCGINPARSFGPALIMNSFKDHWVYWAGPMLGGVAAALLYDFALQPHSEPYSRRIRALRGEVGMFDLSAVEDIKHKHAGEKSSWR